MVALGIMARTTLRQPAPRATVLRWVIAIILCVAQVGCWHAADVFGGRFGNPPKTEPLQWVVGLVAGAWLLHHFWRP